MDQTASGAGRDVKLRAGLTDGDVELMRLAVASGNVSEAQRIVESRGLEWLTGEVGTSQLECLSQAGVGLQCVVGYVGDAALRARVWRAALLEYRRNGGKMITPGKLRWLRRRVRRGR